jgi:hypothetical protein
MILKYNPKIVFIFKFILQIFPADNNFYKPNIDILCFNLWTIEPLLNNCRFNFLHKPQFHLAVLLRIPIILFLNSDYHQTHI